MRWTQEMRDIVRNNYPQKTYKEIASILGVSDRAIWRQLRYLHLTGLAKQRREENKQSYHIVGSYRRANHRYNNIVNRIRHTQHKKNHSYQDVELKVSRSEFIKWFMPLDFFGASVDRIDKTKHYELSNMQVIPLSDNIRKDKVKAKDGKCECYVCHQTKPLIDFCKDKRRGNGHSTICLQCERNRNRKRSLEQYYRKKSLPTKQED